MEEIIVSNNFLFFTLFICVFFFTLFLLPRIRQNSLKFKLYDSPNHRSSHTNTIPTFGGIAFYLSLMFALFYSQLFEENKNIVVLIFSITIMFFIGLKDDLQNLSAKKKFLGQIIAVAILMVNSDFRMYSFHGFLGVYELNNFVSVSLSMFLILGLINAYNLIDGIDGMASIVGIVIASSFGFLFYKMDMYYYLAICITLISTLFAFLRFNFSPRKKIFMGDTGALVVGLVLGMLALKLLSLGINNFSTLEISRKGVPLLMLCILIIPAFDIARVMFIRLNRKSSVFSPDRNHIHHILIDSGFSHKRASVFIGFINIIIILVMFYSIKYFDIVTSIMIFLFINLNLIMMFYIMNKSFQTRRTKVRFRNLLFNIMKVFYIKKKKREIKLDKITFNQKLKKIRILFF
jgi:UDP-N-acetylmuramyl pentapeptide phosphotransferase/UDP-N-acetylglucosamine-1-phosphate transferase